MVGIKGSHIFVYGTPITYPSDTPSSARFCVGNTCMGPDLYDIYAKAPSRDVTVLLAMRDDLDPRSMVDVDFTSMAHPTG